MGQGCLGGPCWCSELATYPSFLKASLVTLRFSAFETHSKNRATVCMLIPCHICHSNSSCLAERPFCFTFFSGSRCAPPYVPQHLASAGRTAAHPSCRWNYHHPRRVGTNLWTFLGIFLESESVVLLFACELRHESIFTITFPSIYLYLTTNPAR